jgi:hypothetical protein
MGATPVSGSIALTRDGVDAVATLPIEIPKGQVFVLTDIEATILYEYVVWILNADDPNNPRFQGVGHAHWNGTSNSYDYQRSFQTGLVFSAAPIIRVINGCLLACAGDNQRASFSGYLMNTSQ